MISVNQAMELKAARFPQDVARWDDELMGSKTGSHFYFVTPTLAKYAHENNGDYAGCVDRTFIFEDDEKFLTFIGDYYAAPEHKRIGLFGEFAKIPTLEELIFEIGQKIMTTGEGMEAYRLMLVGGQVEKSRGWNASSANSTYGKLSKESEGETPEEAVAALWLAMNENRS
mgnify:CR=1 FL=1